MGDDLRNSIATEEQSRFSAAAVEGFLKELTLSRTQFDVFRLMKRVTEHYEARHFMVLNMPPADSRMLSASSVITNWPAEVLNEYDQYELLATSPIFQRLRAVSIPQIFDVNLAARERDSKSAELARSLFTRFHMLRGACFPVTDAAGNRGIVTWCGDMEAFTLMEVMALHFLAAHIFNRLAEIRDMDARVVETLTDRELACLNWTAAGKTSIEISEIMGLSEHTINHYLNRATRKLDTVNRTQAVAKALRLGLIK
ncbi:LuxR family transcriptional regulator [Allorhizobium undicola]|uniref:LuxR family transcriptional regulator n=1 Tax=Allorhizobium undicola TaxID=78527 RepID=UPI003D327E34